MTTEPVIYGMNTTGDEACEIMFRLAARNAELVANERWLNATKWFDYRFLNPVQATYLYAHAYRKVYREKYAAHFDTAGAEYVKGLRSEELFDFTVRNPNRVALWNGRQAADALTMPYELYISIAMEWHLRVKKRDYLPRPNQLYNVENERNSFPLLTSIYNAWVERYTAVLYLAEDERYSIQMYQGLPCQDAYHEWLLYQAGLRSNPTFVLHEMVYGRRALHIEKVALRFGGDMVDKIAALN